MAEEKKVTDVVTGKTTVAQTSVVTPNDDVEATKPSGEQKKASLNNEEFYCDALTEQTINNIADGKSIVVVALVGFAKYGKTTFVSSLYYHFLTEVEFCDHVMCDSDTYMGFERRFLVRSTKTPLEDNQKRTLRGENPLLSMTLAPTKKAGLFKFVISDKTGEDYRDFSIDAGDVEENRILSVANQILFFVDCGVLLNSFSSLQYDYKGLLSELVKSHLIKPITTLRIVFNKFDKIPAEEEQKNRYYELKQRVEQMVSKNFPDNTVLSSEVDSTGVSDQYQSIKKLCEQLLVSDDDENNCSVEKLDWVKKEIGG